MDNFNPTIENSEYLKLLQEIRELKDIKKFSNQDIADKTVENGESVSVQTIKKVFGPKYLEQTFDYNHTLIPIYNALVDKSDKDDPINRILNTRLEIKREQIKQLEIRLEAKEQKHKDREAFLMEQIAFYKDQIKFKDDEIKRFQENIDRKDAMLRKYLNEDE